MFLISWILILEYMFNVHIFKDFFMKRTYSLNNILID